MWHNAKLAVGGRAWRTSRETERTPNPDCFSRISPRRGWEPHRIARWFSVNAHVPVPVPVTVSVAVSFTLTIAIAVPVAAAETRYPLAGCALDAGLVLGELCLRFSEFILIMGPHFPMLILELVEGLPYDVELVDLAADWVAISDVSVRFAVTSSKRTLALELVALVADEGHVLHEPVELLADGLEGGVEAGMAADVRLLAGALGGCAGGLEVLVLCGTGVSWGTGAGAGDVRCRWRRTCAGGAGAGDGCC